MANRFTSIEIKNKFDEVLNNQNIIVMAGAGIGLSAKCEEIGGADIILIDSIGRYRMDGRGSLSAYFGFENANDIVKKLSKEILGVINNTPVIAGVSAADPFCDIDELLNSYIKMGYSAVANNPSVGLFEEEELINLEKTDMGYLKEVDMIKKAKEKDLFTVSFCWRENQAVEMVKAKTDVIVIHFGACIGGIIGAHHAPTFEESVIIANNIINKIQHLEHKPYIFCHGGVLNNPQIVQDFFNAVPLLDGFYGGSAIERIPTEEAITSTGKAFKDLILHE